MSTASTTVAASLWWAVKVSAWVRARPRDRSRAMSASVRAASAPGVGFVVGDQVEGGGGVVPPERLRSGRCPGAGVAAVGGSYGVPDRLLHAAVPAIGPAG
jgi:hypothetical protein